MNWRLVVRRVLAPMLVLMLSWSMVSCSQSGNIARKSLLPRAQNRLAEIAPPAAIQELKQYTDVYQPQVTILSPRPDEVLQDTQTSVKLQVRDLPLSKDAEFELGYHLHLILDNQPYQAVFNADQPIALSDLEPGTHTIRVFASRPWHESFKTEGAFAQTTFHVFAKTPENQPNLNQPLLTYSRPKGDYGAEPVLLDFYLTNAPLHFVAQENSQDAIPDWQIRCTVNGESFTFDRWEPIYLEGLKPGRNWIQLELLDENGNPIRNGFNNTVRIVNYQPNGSDALSRLVRGEIPPAIARRLVDPDYTPPVAEPTATEAPEAAETKPAIESTESPAAEPEAADIKAETQKEPANEPVELKRETRPEAENVNAAPEVPAVLRQPAAEESIREELADEVKEEFQNEPEPPAGKELPAEEPAKRSPVLPLPTEQPAGEAPSREKFTSKFSDKFSGARERAKGMMQRMRKSPESAPSPESAIESAPDTSNVPPVIKAPAPVELPEATPDKAPDPPQAPAIAPTPDLDDLPPTLPEIIEQPDVPDQPSRLPAPIPRFLTLTSK